MSWLGCLRWRLPAPRTRAQKVFEAAVLAARNLEKTTGLPAEDVIAAVNFDRLQALCDTSQFGVHGVRGEKLVDELVVALDEAVQKLRSVG